MEATKPLYKTEIEAVRLRYGEDLCRVQIAEKLQRTPAQVKYVFAKKNVRRYIQEEVLRAMWRGKIAEIEAKLADPVGAYADDLLKRCAARTYVWTAPGQRHFYSDNKTSFPKLSRR